MCCDRWPLQGVSNTVEGCSECSLGRVGVSHETEDSNVLAPGAQLGKYAFESCLTLTSITFVMDHTNQPRALPEGAFCGAGIEQLCLPGDFHNIGPRACENCKGLVEVNLMCTEITALLIPPLPTVYCRRWTQWKHWAYRGVDAGLARFGVPVGSNLTSHLEWLGSTVRFQHF